MNEEEQKTERAEQAARIVANPEAYKICHGCGSIVAVRVSLCPNCHAYHFDDRDTAIVERASHLGRQQSHRGVLASDLE